MRLHLWIVLIMTLLAIPAAGKAEEEASGDARILKVLPHLLDQKGRHTLSPSLFERDAYQAHLKDHPEEVSTLRFDVNWRLKIRTDAKLKLRVEVRFGDGDTIKTVRAEAPLRPKKLRRRGWSSVALDKKTFRAGAQLIAWRVTVWDGDKQMASKHSFLWSS